MKLAANCPINLPVLLETRLLVQAASGYGKSYALRRLLEQTAPHVQQLIIDPEGEFATLREKYDYVIAAPSGGDALAHPKTAAVLARRLLETGVSAVLDIYDLHAHERQSFVRLFLDSLVNAPRELWKPVMVVLDEAHVYCPQNGSAEASQAVIDLATRGRKRGQCLVLATQRLSKLNKDTAAEMLNKLIGRATLDVDVKRAADDLGLSPKEALAKLRILKPGEFFAYGPALSEDVTQIQIGKVETSHPKAGDRLLKAPPAPSAKVRSQLAKLGDLQKEAEKEARTIDELKAEVTKLRAAARKPVIDETEIERRVKAAMQQLNREDAARLVSIERDVQRMHEHIRTGYKLIAAAEKHFQTSPTVQLAKAEMRLPEERAPAPVKVGHLASPRDLEIERELQTRSRKGDPQPLRSGAVRILRELVARSPAGYSKSQVGALTKFSPRGGTFNTYLSDLRRSGFIEERDGMLFATVSGVVQFGEALPAVTTHEEAMAQWERALRSGAFKMLRAVVDANAEGLHRANLADIVNMTAAGGTFNTYLSDLRRNGLIEERGKRLYANEILFP